METSIVVFFLGALIFGAHLFNALFDRLKVPNVLMLLLIGILLGPILGVVTAEHFGQVGPVFSTITLIILLFESGVNLRISQLVSSIGSASLLAIFNFVVSALIAYFVAHYVLSLSTITASYFGAIIAGTSSAVVIPVIKQLKMGEKSSTILVLESALTDVLCLVIGLAIFVSMEKGVVSINNILSSVAISFSVALLVGLGAGVAWSILLEKVGLIQHHIFSTLAFVFITYGIADYFGLNGGIASLAFGISLGNAHLVKSTSLGKIIPFTELDQQEKNFFAEIVFIIQTYFFVYVGVCMQFNNVFLFLVGFVLVAAIILVRPISVKIFTRNKLFSFQELSIMSILTPKGLVPIILASLPYELGIEGGELLRDLTYSVVFISIVLVAILVVLVGDGKSDIGMLQTLFGKRKPAIEETEEQETNQNSTEGIEQQSP